VEGIDPPRFRGRTDLPLSELGRRQAAATAARLAAGWRFGTVYTSPLGRCVETGRAIAEAGSAVASALGGLTDLDYGDWTWKTNDEARAASPDLFDRWFAAPELVRFPGGESLQDVIARTADVLRLALERHPGETVVLVGHDSTLRALLLQVLSQPLSAYWRLAQAPCGISEIDIDNGRICVLRVNETAHTEALIPAGGASGR
jgi:probable phosphoglycerate mutase